MKDFFEYRFVSEKIFALKMCEVLIKYEGQKFEGTKAWGKNGNTIILAECTRKKKAKGQCFLFLEGH